MWSLLPLLSSVHAMDLQVQYTLSPTGVVHLWTFHQIDAVPMPPVLVEGLSGEPQRVSVGVRQISDTQVQMWLVIEEEERRWLRRDRWVMVSRPAVTALIGTTAVVSTGVRIPHLEEVDNGTRVTFEAHTQEWQMVATELPQL